MADVGHNVTTPQRAQGAPDVQGPLPARALLPGARYREVIADVLDTGKRRLHRLAACESGGHQDHTRGYTLALVHVIGEDEPRWIAAERLEPSAADARERWLLQVEENRPVVERHPPLEPERRASRKRYRARQRSAREAAASLERAQVNDRERIAARRINREHQRAKRARDRAERLRLQAMEASL